MFDIKDFYPSISKELLTDALTFAETIINLDDQDKKIIYHSRKSLLFNQEQTWMKKGSDLFDVSMGAYDGAEVCELIGIFLLNLLGRQYDPKNIGLYRDDGLSIFKNCSGPQMEKIKKRLQKVFKNNGLNVIIECNMKIVNYLDATFNLTDGTYRPYQKPDNIIQYIHVESNHPPNIIKQIPKTIEKRLSQLSSSEKIFNESAPFYEDKLHQSGYQQKLKYNPANTETHNNRNHKRNIIWFNPPFSRNVSTKINKCFLNLLDKHFPRNHRFHKIFNRNNVKVSYSCTNSMKTLITNHNKNILGKKPSLNKSHCNCRNKEACPLNGQCQIGEVVYESTLSSNQSNYKGKKYFGIAEESFKGRLYNHSLSFRNDLYKNDTELSKELCQIKMKNYTPEITWRIIRKCLPYNYNSRKCDLCLNEKLEIALYKGENLLNQKTELISKCRHQNKFMLLRHDFKD